MCSRSSSRQDGSLLRGAACSRRWAARGPCCFEEQRRWQLQGQQLRRRSEGSSARQPRPTPHLRGLSPTAHPQACPLSPGVHRPPRLPLVERLALCPHFQSQLTHGRLLRPALGFGRGERLGGGSCLGGTPLGAAGAGGHGAGGGGSVGCRMRRLGSVRPIVWGQEGRGGPALQFQRQLESSVCDSCVSRVSQGGGGGKQAECSVP